MAISFRRDPRVDSVLSGQPSFSFRGTRTPAPAPVAPEPIARPASALRALITPEPERNDVGFAGDLFSSYAQGGIGALKTVTDIFGADNPVSESLGADAEYWRNRISPERKAELARQDAEKAALGPDAGFLERAGLFAEQALRNPATTLAEGAGNVVPMIAGGAGAGALKLGGAAYATGLGALMGAGAVKGGIYDTTLQSLMAQGVPEAEARQRASEAQSYRANPGSIAAGTALGALVGRFGEDEALAGLLRKDAAATARTGLEEAARGFSVRGALTGAAREAFTEAPQESIETILGNRGAINAGADIDPYQGALEAGVKAGIMSAVPGAAGHVQSGFNARENLRALDSTPAAPVAPAGPLVPGSEVSDVLRSLIQGSGPSTAVSPFDSQKNAEIPINNAGPLELSQSDLERGADTSRVSPLREAVQRRREETQRRAESIRPATPEEAAQAQRDAEDAFAEPIIDEAALQVQSPAQDPTVRALVLETEARGGNAIKALKDAGVPNAQAVAEEIRAAQAPQIYEAGKQNAAELEAAKASVAQRAAEDKAYRKILEQAVAANSVKPLVDAGIAKNPSQAAKILREAKASGVPEVADVAGQPSGDESVNPVVTKKENLVGDEPQRLEGVIPAVLPSDAPKVGEAGRVTEGMDAINRPDERLPAVGAGTEIDTPVSTGRVVPVQVGSGRSVPDGDSGHPQSVTPSDSEVAAHFARISDRVRAIKQAEPNLTHNQIAQRVTKEFGPNMMGKGREALDRRLVDEILRGQKNPQRSVEGTPESAVPVKLAQSIDMERNFDDAMARVEESRVRGELTDKAFSDVEAMLRERFGPLEGDPDPEADLEQRLKDSVANPRGDRGKGQPAIGVSDKGARLEEDPTVVRAEDGVVRPPVEGRRSDSLVADDAAQGGESVPHENSIARAEREPASWVAYKRGTTEPLFETFEKATKEKAEKAGLKVVPIIEHLRSLNSNPQERRADTSLREAVSAEQAKGTDETPQQIIARLTEERDQARKERDTDKLSGVGSRYASDEAIKDAKFISTSDMAGLKYINENPKFGGYANGDVAIKAIGKAYKAAAKEVKGVKMFRRGGDEFEVHAQTKEALDRFTKLAEKKFAETVLVFKGPDGTRHEVVGARIDHGTAENTGNSDDARKESERALKANRAAQVAAGDRAPTGQQPVGLRELSRESARGVGADRVETARVAPYAGEESLAPEQLSALNYDTQKLLRDLPPASASVKPESLQSAMTDFYFEDIRRYAPNVKYSELPRATKALARAGGRKPDRLRANERGAAVARTVARRSDNAAAARADVIGLDNQLEVLIEKGFFPDGTTVSDLVERLISPTPFYHPAGSSNGKLSADNIKALEVSGEIASSTGIGTKAQAEALKRNQGNPKEVEIRKALVKMDPFDTQVQAEEAQESDAAEPMEAAADEGPNPWDEPSSRRPDAPEGYKWVEGRGVLGSGKVTLSPDGDSPIIPVGLHENAADAIAEFERNRDRFEEGQSASRAYQDSISRLRSGVINPADLKTVSNGRDLSGRMAVRLARDLGLTVKQAETAVARTTDVRGPRASGSFHAAGDVVEKALFILRNSRAVSTEKTKAGTQVLLPGAAESFDTQSKVGKLKPGQQDVNRGPLFTQDEEAEKKADAEKQRTFGETEPTKPDTLDVTASTLQPGDKLLGSGHTILRVDRQFVPKDATQKGKVRVSYRMNNGEARTGYWNRGTTMRVERGGSHGEAFKPARPNAIVPVQRLFVQVGKRRFEVESFEDASKRFAGFRDAAFDRGATGSTLPKTIIVDQNGKPIARIAQNGKVFPPSDGDWRSEIGQTPLYDPSAPVTAARTETPEITEAVWRQYNGESDESRRTRYDDAVRAGEQILGAPKGVRVVDFEGDVPKEVIAQMRKSSAAVVDRAIAGLRLIAKAAGIEVSLGGVTPAGNLHGLLRGGKVYFNYLATHQMAVEKAADGQVYAKAFAETLTNVLIHEAAHVNMPDGDHGEAFHAEQKRIQESLGQFTYDAIVRDLARVVSDPAKVKTIEKMYDQSVPGWIEGESRGIKAAGLDTSATENDRNPSGRTDGRTGPLARSSTDGADESEAGAGDRPGDGLREVEDVPAGSGSGASDVRGSDDRVAPSDPRRDENFKRWFGDSKVVDKSGKPLVVYHGTGAPSIDVFDFSRMGQNGRSEGAGAYFTTDKEIAEGYGQRGTTIGVFLNIKKPLDYNAKPFSQEKMRGIIKALAKIEAEGNGSTWQDGFLANFAYTSDGATIEGVAREAAKAFDGEERAIDQIGGLVGAGVDAEYVNQAVTEATGFDGYRSEGFSGEGVRGGTIWVAMRPTQIKSATENSGAFDPDNPDIRFARKPVAPKPPGQLLEEETRGQQLQQKLQDRLNRLSLGETAVNVKKGVKADPALAARFYGTAGRASDSVAVAKSLFFDPITELIAKKNLDDALLGSYTKGEKGADAKVKASRKQADYDAARDLIKGAYDYADRLRLATGIADAAEIAELKKERGPLGVNVTDNHPLFESTQEMQRAIIEAERNRATETLADFTEKNGEPSFGTVRKGAPSDGPKKGQNSIGFKRNGEQWSVDLADDKMAKAIKDMNSDQIDIATRTVGAVTRWVSRVNTVLSPLFGIKNKIRDVAGAVISSYIINGAPNGVSKSVAAGVLKNQRSAWKGTREYMKNPGGTFPQGSNAWWAQQAHKHASVPGYFKAIESIERLESELTAAVKSSQAPKISFRRFGDFMMGLAQASEASTRVSMYKALVESGVKPERAGDMARGLLDTNKSGEYSKAIGAFSPFFNASAQGTARLVEMLRSPDPAVKRRAYSTMASLVAAGALVGTALAAWGGDDDEDKIPDTDQIANWDAERNLIIPWLNGTKIKVPLAQGFSAPFFAGFMLSKLSRGTAKAEEAAAAIATAFFDQFSPISSPFGVAQPIADILRNKKFSGAPIRPIRYPGQTQPNSQMALKSTSGAAKAFAQGVNRATGGDDATPGLVDLSPGDVEYLTKAATGGIGKFLGDVYRAAESVAKQEPVKKVPLLSDFVVDQDAARRGRFYAQLRDVDAAESRLKLVEGSVRRQSAQEAYPNADLSRATLTQLRQITAGMKFSPEQAARMRAQDRALVAQKATFDTADKALKALERLPADQRDAAFDRLAESTNRAYLRAIEGVQ